MVFEIHDVELPVWIERRDQRCGHRHEGQKHENAESPRGRAVAEEAAPAFLPQAALAQRAHALRREHHGQSKREPRAQRHAVTMSGSRAARTRSRGSATPTSRSATRLPVTTRVLAISAVAVTSR